MMIMKIGEQGDVRDHKEIKEDGHEVLWVGDNEGEDASESVSGGGWWW